MAERIRIIPQEERVRQILNESGAVLEGHFRYASGLHGDRYINKDAIYPNTEMTLELCRFLAQDFQGKNIQTVVGPQMGGVILSQLVAGHLTRMENRNVWGVFAEKTENDGLEFKRGYEKFVKEKNVLAVEDILNTGGSAKKLIDTIRNAGGNVVALSAIVNRGGVKPEDVGGVPIKSLLDVNMESFKPENCRLCENGTPLNTNVGHAAKK
jgi:orotate phosphoribosyltransferase